MTDHAQDVKNLLTNAERLVSALGWGEGAKRQARGLMIRCPSHNEKDPSCSVRVASDGTLSIKCFGCDLGGDALTMIGLAYGLRPNNKEDFREILATGAEIGGRQDLADEIREGRRAPERKPIARPEPIPETEYPDLAEVEALWKEAGPVDRDVQASRLFIGRGLDPSAIEDACAARALRDGQRLPDWAAYRGRSWLETGHRIIIRVWDARGQLRSVRSWRVGKGDSPKRLPPAGKRAAELVLANRLAVGMLRGGVCPLRLVVVEGEPDWATAITTFGQGDAVIGIGSGSWTENHAKRVPSGTHVLVATHADEAGDRYAAHVIETLGDRCPVSRWRPAA